MTDCSCFYPAVIFNSTMNHTGLYLRSTNESTATSTASFSPEPSRSRCVCVSECTSSTTLGKSHSETHRCLTLSDSRMHLRQMSHSVGISFASPVPLYQPLRTRLYTRGVCAHISVYGTCLCQRRGGAETDPWSTGPIRTAAAARP